MMCNFKQFWYIFTIFHALFCNSIETFGPIPVIYVKYAKYSEKHGKSFKIFTMFLRIFSVFYVYHRNQTECFNIIVQLCVIF